MAWFFLHARTGGPVSRSPTLTIAPDGRILDVDGPATAWLAAARSDLVGRELRDLVVDGAGRIEEVLRSARDSSPGGAMLTSLVFRRPGRAPRRSIVRLRPVDRPGIPRNGLISLQVEDAGYERSTRR